MAKTRNSAIRESEGCCIVCLGFGNCHTRLPGRSPGLERKLCTECFDKGFRVEQVMERFEPVPYTYKLTTPEGDVLDVSTAPKKPIGAGRMKKLRAKDQVLDEGLVELFREIRRAGGG